MSLAQSVGYITDVKTVFTFFYFGHVFTFCNVFLFSRRFFIFKKRWQSSERETD